MTTEITYLKGGDMFPTLMAAAAAEHRRELRDVARRDRRAALLRAAVRRPTLR
jgi:heme exporter protein D